jgi:branched-chain amino acid aminotransferase
MLPDSETGISINDYGFLFGYGVFAGMRAYNGKVFRLDTKLERVRESAEKLGIKTDIPAYKDAVGEIITANNLQSALVRITVTSGEGPASPDPGKCTGTTVLITATEYTPFPEETYEKGIRAIVSSVRRNSQSPASVIKSLNYLESIMARKEARDASVDNVVQLNDKGKVAEASNGNLFLVKDSILKTPSISCGIIPGIVREAILELASQLNIKAVETEFELDELLAADEAFLTNVLMEVMPLVNVGGQDIGPGKPGEITQKLLKAYREEVQKEIG